MTYIYLGSKYNEFAVGDEAYAQIVALVKANKLCTHKMSERHPYSENNPCVGKGICLEHLLERQPQLTRLDIVGVWCDLYSLAQGRLPRAVKTSACSTGYVSRSGCFFRQ